MPEWSTTEAADPLARDRLILDHVPLLRHIVGRLSFDTSRVVDRDDMYGFGMLGLIAAADSWDRSRGLAFSTYAYTKIRGAILDELRRVDFLPRGRRERVRAIEGAISRLEQQHGQKPSPEELAAELATSVEEIDVTLLQAMSAVQTSLDNGPDEGLAAMLSDPRSEGPVGSLEWEETKSQLASAISELPEQEKTVITLYYSEELLLREISEILGVTESRVSQIHSRALYRLNRALTGPEGIRR